MIRPTFIDHLVFRAAELDRSERFYTVLQGEVAYRTEDSFMYVVGETRIFFSKADGGDQPYEKEHVGLNHLAFGVRTLEDLKTISGYLERSGIAHSGIVVDEYGHKEFLWLNDPDGMRVEFYLRVTAQL